jgi:methylmalonyl-CoA/ethylmalonyl-CoA epimerase
MLSKPEPQFDHPGSILYFKVDDIEARHRDLARRAVDHELWMTFFRDTEGNTLALMEEKRGG